MPCPSRRSSTSRSSCAPGWTNTFQLARCYRDEVAGRSPAWNSHRSTLRCRSSSREDIYNLIEGLLKRVWKTALDIDVPTPFLRIPFEEVMNRWGIDKPDTRFDMEIVDMTDDFASSEFKVFSGVVSKGGVVKVLNAKGFACVTQGQMETMTDYAKGFGAKGLAYIKVENGEWKSPIVKFFSDAEKAALQKKMGIGGGRSHPVRRRRMAQRLRNPRQNPPLLRRETFRDGQDDPSQPTSSISSGWSTSRC